MAEITFLCKRTVVSTTPVEPGKFYPLSVLDHIMESSNIRIICYYRFSCETEPGLATKKLRESISEMLTSFPKVTGRLQKNPEGHWMIKCNDAGVRMIEARASGSVEEWLQNADREQELKLVYWEDMYHNPYFWSTFYVQLTEFEGGGIAIGLSCSHLLADAACATLLIKAWADATLSRKMLTPPHFHSLPPRRIGDRDMTLKPYDDLINYYKSSLERATEAISLGTQRYATVTFSFSDDMVKKCMSEAYANDSPTNDSKSTPFAALASLFWLGISEAKGKKGGLVDMSICLDGRNVLGLDKGFFGNCMVFNKVCGEKLKDIGLVKAAKAINNVMEKMEYGEIMDLVEWLESKRNDDEPPVPVNGPDLICVNWENLDPYSAMFECSVKPLHVSYYLERVFGDGQVLILPSAEGANGDGSLSRVAMVTLPEHEMLQLCDEALIRSFSPTILMDMKENQG